MSGSDTAGDHAVRVTGARGPTVAAPRARGAATGRPAAPARPAAVRIDPRRKATSMSTGTSPTKATAGAPVDLDAIRDVPRRITAAWAAHDGAAFGAAFTEDGTLILPGGVFRQSREEIGSYMTAAFAGPYQDTRVFGEPVNVRVLGPGTAVIVTRGGVLLPGEEEVAPAREVRATWVLVEHDGGWLIASYQNTATSES